MRLPRLFAPGQVQLVQVQFVPELAQRWLAHEAKHLLDKMAGWLGEYVSENQLALHAWSLSPARMLLLLTAPDNAAVANTIQGIGRRLAPELKVGSVFEARYKSALIAPDWVLLAQIWVESAPIDDGYIVQASAWPWSSAAGHIGIGESVGNLFITVSDHESYWGCGNTPFDRQANYRARLVEGLASSEREAIESAVSGQWALGSGQYVEQISKIANRRVMPGKRGRPSKAHVKRGSVPN